MTCAHRWIFERNEPAYFIGDLTEQRTTQVIFRCVTCHHTWVQEIGGSPDLAKTLPPPTNDAHYPCVPNQAVARCEACSGTGFTVNSGGGKDPCPCTGEFA